MSPLILLAPVSDQFNYVFFFLPSAINYVLFCFRLAKSRYKIWSLLLCLCFATGFIEQLTKVSFFILLTQTPSYDRKLQNTAIARILYCFHLDDMTLTYLII